MLVCWRLVGGGCMFGMRMVPMAQVVRVVSRMVVPATGSIGRRRKQQNEKKRKKREAFHDEQATTHSGCVYGQAAEIFHPKAPQTATAWALQAVEAQL